MRPIVHSVKHHVQFPITQITTAAAENMLIVSAVESTAANLATEVEEGTIIKAVYVEMWLQNQGNLGTSIAILEKTTLANSGATFTNLGNLFAYVNKKNILFTHEGLTSNDAISGPVRIIGQWFKIPKGKQRFGLGDRLFLSIANVSSSDLNRCGFALYKEMS